MPFLIDHVAGQTASNYALPSQTQTYRSYLSLASPLDGPFARDNAMWAEIRKRTGAVGAFESVGENKEIMLDLSQRIGAQSQFEIRVCSTMPYTWSMYPMSPSIASLFSGIRVWHTRNNA
jgi:hypothetical protein